MKRLLRYTSTLLRTALLLGAAAFVNVEQAKGQPAAMPNAFQGSDPATIIGDGNYYYIQFYETGQQSYLADCGVNKIARPKDFLPYANNRLWTLVSVGANNQFKLKNKDGHYLRFGVFKDDSDNKNKERVGCVDNYADASILTFQKIGDGYCVYRASDTGNKYPMYRPGHGEWAGLAYNSKLQSGLWDVCHVRFVKLKPNAAFIIYYRGEAEGDAGNGNSTLATTRHYMTYSGTDASLEGTQYFWSSDISSRKSVIPSDMALCALPTVAAYHKDGLWMVEKADVDGQFYIKRYDNGKYLNKDYRNGNYSCKLENNPTDVYTLETPDANRYTRVRNVVYTNTTLEESMFKRWTNYGKDKGTESSLDNFFENNIGQSVDAGATVIGTGGVDYLTYADLSEYQKMTINGTEGMQLRVLMSRQIGQTGKESQGPLVEKLVTIGSDSKAVVDLTDLHLRDVPNQQLPKLTNQTGATVKATYINGYYDDNAGSDSRGTVTGEITTGEILCGRNKITNGTVGLYNHTWSDDAFVTYLEVDVSNFHGAITNVTLTGFFKKISYNGRQMEYGVGYNNSAWSDMMTWNNADRSITTLGETQKLPSEDGEQELSFDITDAFASSKKMTILVYNYTAGKGYIKNPVVTVDYIPDVSDVIIDYAHLNAIKTNTAGTVSSITLSKESDINNSSTLYLHHANGDGWQVLQWPENGANNQHWYAGFYPVEVPESGNDEFYGVLLGINPPVSHKTIGLTGGDMTVSSDGHTFTPNAAYQRAFRHVNLNTGSYRQIVIKFGGEDGAPDGWQIHTYGGQFEGLVDLKRKKEYVVNLQPGRAMDDFTIFNTNADAQAITIDEIYYTPDLPTEMVGNDGCATAYSELDEDRVLWKLEMTDNYRDFRLKNTVTGKYLKGNCQVTDSRNDAKVYTNVSLTSDFYLRWFIPTRKEIDVSNREILHRENYLREYSDNYPNVELGRQGLVSDRDDHWKTETGIQKTNHFEITHYIKRGASFDMEFPTVLNGNNDHRYYQRFFTWDADGNEQFDAASLKEHLNIHANGNVQYYLYKNGIVTGEKLYWPEYTTLRHSVQASMSFTNTDGTNMTVVADVSRYSDYDYKNASSPLDDDLIEPSLTMRYIYYMRDAKSMANELTACTAETGKWLEEKTFHFPSKRIFYNKSKWVGYRGQFIPIRHVFSDYWVYDDPKFIKKDSNGKVVYDANGKVVLDTDYISTKSGKTTKEEIEAYLDEHLVSAVKDINSGRIEVVLEEKFQDDNLKTGIRLGGWNPVLAASHDGNLRFTQANFSAEEEAGFTGYYFYDKMYNKTNYGNSRFMAFRYPSSDDGVKAVVTVNGEKVVNEAYLNMYLVDDTDPDPQKHKRYRLARFTLIFDPDTETLPWTSVNGSDQVKDNTKRDPRSLVQLAGKPIARVTFDYPAGTPDTYQYPSVGSTLHNQREEESGGSIANSSPLPLTFDHTNYSFDGDECNWGAYAMVTEKNSTYGNDKIVLPANDLDHGYGLATDKRLLPDEGRHAGFMYIDASEQPGDICAIDFEGEFCPGDELMCSGWITGSNKYNDNSVYRCPGGVTLTVKGENAQGKTETIYRFVPGQCYELDNGTSGVDGSSDDATHVVWQQFFFKFSTDKKYERYWLEVNNNCVSSNGGDFMLDNIEVYTIVPELIPDINTPLCVSLDENGNQVTEMRLLRLDVEFNKLLSSADLNEEQIASMQPEDYPELGFVFLEKEEFLRTFKQKLNLNISLEELAQQIAEGKYDDLTKKGHSAYQAYKDAFDAALLGTKNVWHSRSVGTTYPIPTKGAGVLYFRWNPTFEGNTVFKFGDAVNKHGAVYRYTNPTTNVQYLVLNGNYPELPWKTCIDYYIVPTNVTITESELDDKMYETFNICSECSRVSVFRIEPPLSILGLDKSEATNDYIVCEGKIPTIVLNLKGFDLDGNEVDMKDLNFDWWLGNETTLATLDKFHEQNKDITINNETKNVRLDQALSILRSYYRGATSLDGIDQNLSKTPNLTRHMTAYLRELVAAGELVLNQKSVSVPAKKADGNDDPYFYLVACPIHDEKFDQALNPQANQYVAYFCQEPQGLRVKVEDKAPTLKTGFVKGENGYDEKDYDYEGDPVLSIRLAKAAQFETVKHGDVTDNPTENYNQEDNGYHFLWLPVRNAAVQTTTSTGVVRKSATTEGEINDYNVYLASTNDSVWNQWIYDEMSKPVGSLPIVGKIVTLNAIDTQKSSEKEEDNNRLCIYFTENFEVREGYTYTLSLPFKEAPGTNTCDGTILINLKIVPDYEVWTGAAGNTDWNNDENWRRADGNTEDQSLSAEEQQFSPETQENLIKLRKRNKDELYVKDAASYSPLHNYKHNVWNYRTEKDRVFRKGFAPLYCTHVLMSSDEWGNAPELYDAIDNQTKLTNWPFPNLRNTSTAILKFDMQARLYEMWPDIYGATPNKGQGLYKGRDGDLIAEMYQINSCDEIAFQPGTELREAHLLNYNSAWVEYKIANKRWYLLGSPLQGTIAGEWYAPTGNAKQETTYYDPITFNAPVYTKVDNPTGNPSTQGYYRLRAGKLVTATETTVESDVDYYTVTTARIKKYDRYSPAIYQRSWDKAKAVLYEVDAQYSTDDDAQNNTDDVASQGSWANNNSWNAAGADDYLDRLGYKPFGNKKANVAIQGIWSNTYNDATVDYANGGFSVMVLNHLKGDDQSNDETIVRLPKEDTMYDYYKITEDGSDNGGTDTELSTIRDEKNRAKNRGRLKTDLLLPEPTQTMTDYSTPRKTEAEFSIYGDKRIYTRVPTGENPLLEMNSGTFTFTEDLSEGASSLGYYLVENPFPCGLDMKEFFNVNGETNGMLQNKYWLLTPAATGQNPRQVLVQQAGNEWVTSEGGTFAPADAILAPGQGFFVEVVRSNDPSFTPPTTITFNKDMQTKSRFGVKGAGTEYTIEVGREQITNKVQVDVDGDGTLDNEYVEEIVYEDDGVTPKTKAITDKVIVYDYKQEKDNSDKYVGYELKARTRSGDKKNLAGLVITAKRAEGQSSALVMMRDGASNDFLPEEDTETFINSDLKQVPTVYTLCGRLATTINSIRDFRSLPVGVESTSDAPCVLTFNGVELLGDSIGFYDAVTQKLTPLESGMSFTVSGQTQNRYYIVSSLDLKEAAEETHLQIFAEGHTAKVIASTAEPIVSVHCYDAAGQLVHAASPQMAEYSFTLPDTGVYIIDAQTDNDRKTKKVITK